MKQEVEACYCINDRVTSGRAIGPKGWPSRPCALTGVPPKTRARGVTSTHWLHRILILAISENFGAGCIDWNVGRARGIGR